MLLAAKRKALAVLRYDIRRVLGVDPAVRVVRAPRPFPLDEATRLVDRVWVRRVDSPRKDHGWNDLRP